MTDREFFPCSSKHFAPGHSGRVFSGEPNDDYGNPRRGWLLILLLLAAVVTVTGYVAIYFGVQYGIPSWGAHAYPPPIVR